MRELWRKRVKNDWLRLKLAGRDEKSIGDILDKRYDNFLKRVSQVKSADVFQTFMNAYTTAIEPHTNYLGPRAAAEFSIAMRLSLVGIGASLAELDEYTTIRELVPGGPASLSGLLNIGDRIVGVAQGENGAMTEVMGWRLDDTVALDQMQRVEAFAELAGLGVPKPDPVADAELVCDGAEERCLHLAEPFGRGRDQARRPERERRLVSVRRSAGDEAAALTRHVIGLRAAGDGEGEAERRLVLVRREVIEEV